MKVSAVDNTCQHARNNSPHLCAAFQKQPLWSSSSDQQLKLFGFLLIIFSGSSLFFCFFFSLVRAVRTRYVFRNVVESPTHNVRVIFFYGQKPKTVINVLVQEETLCYRHLWKIHLKAARRVCWLATTVTRQKPWALIICAVRVVFVWSYKRLWCSLTGHVRASARAEKSLWGSARDGN